MLTKMKRLVFKVLIGQNTVMLTLGSTDMTLEGRTVETALHCRWAESLQAQAGGYEESELRRPTLSSDAVLSWPIIILFRRPFSLRLLFIIAINRVPMNACRHHLARANVFADYARACA